MGMTTEVVRHEDYVPGCLDGYDLVIVGPGPGDPRDDADPKMVAAARGGRPRCWPRSSRSSRSASATRRCATSSGSRWPTRTSSSRAPSRRSRRRAHRAGRLLQHLRRPGRRRRRCPPAYGSRPTPRPATSTRWPARTTAASSSTPSRSSPSTATTCCTTWSPSCCSTRRRFPTCVVVDHHDSYTWNLVHLVAVGDRRAADRRAARRGVAGGRAARTRTSCCRPGPGTPTIPADFAVGREVLLAGDPAGARRLPRHAGPGDDVRRRRRPGRRRRTARWRGSSHDGAGRLRRAAAAVRGGALPLARGARRARRRWR